MESVRLRDMGRYGEIWGDHDNGVGALPRYGEIWGDMGSSSPAPAEAPVRRWPSHRLAWESSQVLLGIRTNMLAPYHPISPPISPYLRCSSASARTCSRAARASTRAGETERDDAERPRGVQRCSRGVAALPKPGAATTPGRLRMENSSLVMSRQARRLLRGGGEGGVQPHGARARGVNSVSSHL